MKSEEVTLVDWRPRAFACATLCAAGFMASCAQNGAGSCDPGADVQLIQCPGLFTLLVAPDKVATGGSVAVSATAASGLEGGTAVLSWSAPSGKFSDPSSALTTFRCTVVGLVTLTLTVAQPGCSETLRAQVECLGQGDGGDQG